MGRVCRLSPFHFYGGDLWQRNVQPAKAQYVSVKTGFGWDASALDVTAQVRPYANLCMVTLRKRLGTRQTNCESSSSLG